jgi:hypothetical protein
LGYLALINRINFRQECYALYSHQLNAEPAHSTTAAWRTMRPFYNTKSSCYMLKYDARNHEPKKTKSIFAELLRFVERTTSTAAQQHYGILSAPHRSALKNPLLICFQNGSTSNTRNLLESRSHGIRNPTTHHQFLRYFFDHNDETECLVKTDVNQFVVLNVSKHLF